MREQLIRYVELLFAGAPDAVEIRQEILQNTLDRYDDLIAQGKSPEAAYRLAISGIGDINEILGGTTEAAPSRSSAAPEATPETPVWKKILRAVAVAMYILCPVPLFVLQNEVGLCGLLTFVAVATSLMVIGGGRREDAAPEERTEAPKSPRKKLVGTIIWSVTPVLYLVVSFLTRAWALTWLLFPIAASLQGLISACMDLKEAK